MHNYIIIGILAVLLILIAGKYNNLVILRNGAINRWNQVDISMQERNDLLPSLVNVVKDYAKGESEIFEGVITARNTLMTAQSRGNVTEAILAENQLKEALRALYELRNSYPALDEDSSFQELKEGLIEMENKIASLGQDYSNSAIYYNTEIKKFPGKIISNIFSFEEMVLFELKS